MKKRIISAFLCLTLLLTSAQTTVFADNPEPVTAETQATSSDPEQPDAPSDITDYDENEASTEDFPDDSQPATQPETSEPDNSDGDSQEKDSQEESEEISDEKNADATESETTEEETLALVSPITDENYSMVLSSDSVSGEYGIALLADSSNSCGPNVRFSINSSGTLTISGTGEMTEYMRSIDLPWYDQTESVKSIVVESGVTSISNFAFWNCKNATSVKIGDTVKYIGKSAFGYCQSLTQISLPASVTSIDLPAFNNCYNLQKFTVDSDNKNYSSAEDGILYNKSKDTLVCYPIGKTSATYKIPKTIRYIHSGAFTDNTSISQILVESGNTSFTSSNGVLFNSSKDTLIRYPVAKVDETYSLPSSVRYVSEYAFYNCDYLKNITFTEGLRTIGEHAFGGCDNLRYLEIPDSVDSMGENVFWACIGLLTVRLPLNLTEIPFSAFFECSNLKEIEIPNRVQSVLDYAFYECTNLASVYFRQNIPVIEPLAFSETEFYELSVSEDPVGWARLDENRFHSLTGFKKIIAGIRYQWITYSDSQREEFSLYRDNNSFSNSDSYFGSHYYLNNYLSLLESNEVLKSNPVKNLACLWDKASDWAGSCFGIAASILDTMAGRLKGISGGLHYYNMRKPSYKPLNDSTYLINYYHLAMNYCVDPETTCAKGDNLSAFLTEMVSKANNDEPFILLFNANYKLNPIQLMKVKKTHSHFTNKEGHTVIVNKISTDDRGNHILQVYDPNNTDRYYDFVISGDYRSFSFQDANNEAFCTNQSIINALGQDVVDDLHIDKIWTNLEIYSLGSIMNLPLKSTDQNISEGHRDVSLYSLESDEAIEGYSVNDSETVQIAINTDDTVTIRNKEGLELITDGDDYSGTMQVYDKEVLGEKDYMNLLTVDASDSFTVVTENTPISIIIQTKEQTYYAETDSAQTITVSLSDGLVITGNSSAFTAGVTTDLYESKVVFIDGISEGDISLNTTTGSVQLSSSGFMTDLVIHDIKADSNEDTRISETVSSFTLSNDENNGISINKEISFALDQSNIKVKPGQTTQIHPLTEGVTLSDIQWSTTDESVATVSNGLITAVAEGTATIKAKTSDGRVAEVLVEVLSSTTLFITGTSKYDYSLEVLELLNAERKSRGLTELKMDEKLFEDANQRAAELAVYYSHTRPDGTSCFTINGSANAENIAVTYATPQDVFNGWMTSTGHRENMLALNARGIGIGCFNINGVNYWAQLFSSNVRSEIDSSAEYTSVQKRYTISTGDTTLNIDSVLDVTLGIGEKQEMKVLLKNLARTSLTIYPDNDSFAWISDNPSIAEVSNGIITGKKAGSTGVNIIYGKQGGPFYVTVTNGDIVINKQPESTSGYVGDTVAFKITAENVKEYQWYYSTNGNDWTACTESGAKTDTLTLRLTETNAVRSYRCSLTDNKGRVTNSNIVGVTLYKRVLITKQPQNVTAKLGGDVSFSVTAENAVSYQWYYSQNNGSTWIKSTLPGAKTDTISFKLAESNENNIYRCILTDNAGATVSTNTVKAEITTLLTQNPTAIPHTYEIGVNLETFMSIETTGVGKITYTSSDPDILSIDGMFWSGNKLGDVTITAHFGGDKQYLPADVKFTMHVVEYVSLDSDSCGDNAAWDYYYSAWPQSEKKAYIVISGTGNAEVMQRSSGHYLWDQYNKEYDGNTLDHIIVEEGITGIGDYFFACKASGSSQARLSDSQKTITLADSVQTIGNRVFAGCTKLETLNIGAGVASMGSFPFMYCSSLKNINVSPQNKTFKSVDGCLLSKDGTVLYKVPDKYKEYVIPDGVVTIATDALGDMLTLEKVTIPSSVKTIKSYAFDGSNNLKQIIYKGTEILWSEISIESGNTVLTQAAIQYANTSDIAKIDALSISIFDDGTLRLNTYVTAKNDYGASIYAQTEFQDAFAATYETGEKWKETKLNTLPVDETRTGYTTYILSKPLNSGELTRGVLFRIQLQDGTVLDQRVIEAADLLNVYLSPAFEETMPGLSADYFKYLREVSRATLNYGTCAQKYFGRWYDQIGTSANWYLSDADKKLTPITTQELVNGSLDYRNAINTDNLTGIQYVGSSLLLQDEVKIRHYFAQTDNIQKKDYQFTLTRKGQSSKTLTVETRGKLLYVEYPAGLTDVRAADTVAITTNGKTESFQYSLMNYIGMVQSSENTALKDLVTALYRLSELFD